MDELVFKQIRCRAHLQRGPDSPGNVLYAAISICCINGWSRGLAPPANKSQRGRILSHGLRHADGNFAKVNPGFQSHSVRTARRKREIDTKPFCCCWSPWFRWSRHVLIPTSWSTGSERSQWVQWGLDGCHPCGCILIIVVVVVPPWYFAPDQLIFSPFI